jgi:GntR family carbon starvation induced transcriptional regulator
MNPTRSTSTATQTDRAFGALRTAIVRCEFAPEQRLAVDELCQRFAMSSSPLREALSRLVAHGLVNAFEHRGFRVAPLTLEGIADLTRVRLLVEADALGDSIQHGDDRWESDLVAAAHALSLVERRLDNLSPALDDEWSIRHRAFHMAIYAACSSPLLRQLVSQLFDQAERYRCFAARSRRVPHDKNAEHQRLLTAVMGRNVGLARKLVGQHILSTRQRVEEALRSLSPAT